MRFDALLLDYGGVLTSSVLDSFAAFCVAEDIDFDLFRSVVLESARGPDSIFQKVEKGLIDQAQFDEALAGILRDATGKDVAAVGLKQRLFSASTPDEAMLDAVRELRKDGVKTALVSNSWGGADYPRHIFGDLFDAVIVSGEVGLRKPDREIYLLAAEQLGVDPERCVFVDDFRVNVEGASAVGMRGILHSDTTATIEELKELFAPG
jgi:putative hydrolase of the HAD superfamily